MPFLNLILFNKAMQMKSATQQTIIQRAKVWFIKKIIGMSKIAQTINMFERLPFTLFTDRLRINSSWHLTDIVI